MNKFSKRSLKALENADYRWSIVMNVVLQHVDCTILEGHRIESVQNQYFEQGKSKLEWPNSKHNKLPSLAIDVAPYYVGEGIPWDDRERFVLFAGFVKGVAATLGHKVRWGGDWDSDWKMKDQTFFDLPHFEFVDD